ncbi:MAG: tetrahydrofolate dehydrogenase/cyclohydrolase catalytic domain-containing protein [Gammaproteobacteria bacterium]|nr:tetrahydrofolate dehydrogenase/cyclohydrolase catalytic domain-containing protein [Gammaproteobacteria bacterium]
MIETDPARVARSYVDQIAAEIADIDDHIKVIGFIASDDLPSLSYAKATRQKFSEVGIEYDLQSVERLALEDAIMAANADPAVHGIFIYFPVFHNQQDSYLRNLVDYRKDIEAGSMYWVSKLYANDRFAIDGDHYAQSAATLHAARHHQDADCRGRLQRGSRAPRGRQMRHDFQSQRSQWSPAGRDDVQRRRHGLFVRRERPATIRERQTIRDQRHANRGFGQIRHRHYRRAQQELR